jgi:3-hydroxyacyl-[acyl-carrier-protein] dehydratase
MNDVTLDSSTLVQVNIEDILKMVPHRYPMVLVDRLHVINEDEAIGIKNVTFNEQFFQGHFPNKPIMPGVLIIEAMAQSAGILVMHNFGPDAGEKMVYFMSIEDARFRRPVVPGDTLYIHVKKIRQRGRVWKFKAEVKVKDKLVAEGTYSAMIAEIENDK